jgi:hypothetical protein
MSTAEFLPTYLFDGHTYLEFGGQVLDSSSPLFWAAELSELAVLSGLSILVLAITICAAQSIISIFILKN